MQSRGRYGLLLLGVLVNGVGVDGAVASEPLAESYIQAQEFGRRDESDPSTVDYHRNVLLPQFSERYQALLRACQSTLPQPDRATFSFVAALGAEGEILRVWSDRTPPVYACVRGRLLFERFSPPPRTPFYLYIHMRFAQ